MQVITAFAAVAMQQGQSELMSGTDEVHRYCSNDYFWFLSPYIVNAKQLFKIQLDPRLRDSYQDYKTGLQESPMLIDTVFWNMCVLTEDERLGRRHVSPPRYVPRWLRIWQRQRVR
jgi:hypothetical protein